MKILSKKKYNQLLDKMKDLETDNRQLIEKNNILSDRLEDKKTGCKANVGKGFCNACKNSYSYESRSGLFAFDSVGCLLDTPCESFERKESE